MIRAVILAALLLAGCGTTKYVPVEVARALPEAPAECFTPVPAPTTMSPLPSDPDSVDAECLREPLSVCVAKRARRAEISSIGKARRANAEKKVCEAYVRSLRSP